MRIPDHISDAQIFDCDSLVSGNVVIRCFMKKIIALVRNFFMSPCNKYSGSGAACRTFLSSGKPSLPHPEFLFSFSEEPGIIEMEAIGINDKAVQANVNSDGFNGFRTGNIV